MLKILISTLKIMMIILAGFFQDEGVTVTGTIPARITAGEEVAIEIRISKPGVSGFGTLQVELPNGFSITQKDDQGAEYAVTEGKSTWKWASMPAGDEIILKFSVKADRGSFGPKAISAVFSYIEDNERQQAEMTPAEIDVLAAPAQDVAADSTIQKFEREPDAAISTKRSHKVTATGEVLVELAIRKGNTKGFARYSDVIASDCKAKAVKTDGASFSVADGRLKFVWVNVPAQEELVISYVLSCKSSGSVTLDGEYAYVEQNQTKKHKIPAETVGLQTITQSNSDSAASPDNSNETGGGKGTTPEKAKQKQTKKETGSEIAENRENANGKKETGAEENAGGPALFSVQVGAFTNSKITSVMLRKRFAIKDEVRSEMSDGLNKFMTGSFSQYRKARDKREKLRQDNRVKSAFVVAYNGGKRITVQEGLMLNGQKWLK